MANLEGKLTSNRRNFLKATGLTAAAFIGANLLSSCTPKTPAAEIPEAPAAPTEDPNSQKASQIIKETVEKYPTIESLAGDPEELKRKMTIPAGLSDEDFAQAWVSGIDLVFQMGRPDDPKFTMGTRIDAYKEGREESAKRYAKVLVDAYKEAVISTYENSSGIDEYIEFLRTFAASSVCCNAATSSVAYPDSDDKEPFRWSATLDTSYPSEQSEYGGRTVTTRVINWSIRNNRDKNRIGKPGSELYLDANDYPERAMHQSTIVTEVIDGRETLVDLKNDSVI